MDEEADQAADHRGVAKPLQRALPEFYGPRDARILREAAVEFGLRGIVEDVHYAGAADALGIVDAGLREVVVIAELLGASFGEFLHVVLAAEVQAAGGAGLDAGGLEAFADAVGAECALVDALGFRIELGNVERAAGDAVAAADAVGLLEVDDAVGVLDDGAVGGARFEAAGLGAVHALIFAHQPHQRAVFALVLVEEDQVPVVPAGFRHGLVGVAEDGFAEGEIVPLHAGDFAGFAADAGGGVDEFADGVLALRVFAGNAAGVTGDFLNA